MASRQGALDRAATFFDQGHFKALLGDLVAYPSTSQEAGAEAALTQYLEEGIAPWAQRLGFETTVHPNPLEGFGPILTGIRIEDPAFKTVVLYGYRRGVSERAILRTYEQAHPSHA